MQGKKLAGIKRKASVVLAQKQKAVPLQCRACIIAMRALAVMNENGSQKVFFTLRTLSWLLCSTSVWRQFKAFFRMRPNTPLHNAGYGSNLLV